MSEDLYDQEIKNVKSSYQSFYDNPSGGGAKDSHITALDKLMTKMDEGSSFRQVQAPPPVLPTVQAREEREQEYAFEEDGEFVLHQNLNLKRLLEELGL